MNSFGNKIEQLVHHLIEGGALFTILKVLSIVILVLLILVLLQKW